jgi:hypothetical protein
MNAKGTAVAAVASFVKTRFGSDGYERWLKSLPQESRDIFDRTLLASAWYPAEAGVFTPQKVMCDLFFNGSPYGAREQGRHSADQDLRGIYRMFVRVANPSFLIRNVAGIWGSYYSDSKARAAIGQESGARLYLAGITPVNPYLMNAVAGWVERALEICGCTGISVGMETGESEGKSLISYDLKWNR